MPDDPPRPEQRPRHEHGKPATSTHMHMAPRVDDKRNETSSARKRDSSEMEGAVEATGGRSGEYTKEAQEYSSNHGSEETPKQEAEGMKKALERLGAWCTSGLRVPLGESN